MKIKGQKVVNYIPNNTNYKIKYKFEDGTELISNIVAWAVLESGDLIPVDKTKDLDSTIYVLSNKEYLSVNEEGDFSIIKVKDISLIF